MFVTLLKVFLMPPALQLVMMLLAALLWRRRVVLSRVMMIFAWGSLLALSMPIVSTQLFTWLEAPYLNTAASQLQIQRQNPKAVVVLGGDRTRNAPEYGGDQVSEASLWRLRYGAILAKEHQLPVIASGGTVYPYELKTEAQMAAQALENEWNVQTVWQEGNSRDTWRNAQQTAALLAVQLGQDVLPPVILVTHAYHMRRAQYAFEQAGVSTIPAPTGFRSVTQSGWRDDWLPQSYYLHQSRIALHEYLGLAFYRMR